MKIHMMNKIYVQAITLTQMKKMRNYIEDKIKIPRKKESQKIKKRKK
jgi:hypothetical protein